MEHDYSKYGVCKRCGAGKTAKPCPGQREAAGRHPVGNASTPSRGTIPTLVFAGSILLSACAGGVAAGYHGYAQDISSGDPFVVWLWYVLLPAGALALSWYPGKLIDWSSGMLLAAPFVTLIGFWTVYRHPDLWTSGAFSAAASGALCVAVYSLGLISLRWKPQFMVRVRWLYWLVSILSVVYSITAISLLLSPLEVEYELHALRYKGQGVLNGASTDTVAGTGNQMYFCDQAVLGDLTAALSRIGYSGISTEMMRGSRKMLGGPMLRILPIHDRSILGK